MVHFHSIESSVKTKAGLVVMAVVDCCLYFDANSAPLREVPPQEVEDHYSGDFRGNLNWSHNGESL